ncbi:SDR family oxidoreductase [Leekyejoonella antrihumi]|nr:NAD(P)H-binding protein [Leekyejoonella antrihumi]
MSSTQTYAVTGAFSYSGRAITAELKARGHHVRTLTAHPRRTADAEGPDEVRPLNFDDPGELRSSLRGVDTLINTFWVRFPHGGTTFADAVDRSNGLLDAAVDAGVRRIVHVSITHADPASPYAYFAGKGLVEQHLTALPIGHSVLRPAILFGGQAVLINNIAWLLRNLPVFAIGGRGTYRIRGIHLADLAHLCADEAESDTDVLLDAVGPERPTFRELVTLVRTAVGSRAALIDVPEPLVPVCAAALGAVMRDTLLTKQEYQAMAHGLADTTGAPTGDLAISDWIAKNGHRLGRTYLNDTRGRRMPR